MRSDWVQTTTAPAHAVDVLIIGAGPAGISVALHLLKQDPAWSGRMLILEKAAHPRPKLCGGGVTRLGLELLQDLDFPLPLPIPQARVDDVRLVYGHRVVHVRGQPQVAIFCRPELDAYLAEQARQRGAVIRQNEPVERFSLDETGATVTTAQATYRAQVLVGADGSKGVIRQALGRSEPRTRVARLLETLNPARADAPVFGERYARFDFTAVRQDLQGYFWDFPSWVEGQPVFNRGLYDARVARRRARANLPRLLRDELADREVPPQSAPLAGHPIHWFSPRSLLSRPRLLLVGDAAGAEPLFGEGIAPALGYGEVAAQAIMAAFAAGDFSFRDYRWRLFRSPVGRYLLVRWAVAWWSYHFSGHRTYMHFIWSLGNLLTRLFPEPPPLYQQGPDRE